MVRPQGAHMLAVLLVVLLGGCVALLYAHKVGVSKMPNPLENYTPDSSYRLPKILTLRHTQVGELHTYEGTLIMPLCDTFSTSINSKGTYPAHVDLAFVVLRPNSFCSNMAASSTPFSIALSSNGEAIPILDSVTINGIPVSVMLEKNN